MDVRGTCTPAALARLNPPDGSVVICDCDGAEVELIDPVQVGWLRRSTLLVEVHETFAPGAETTLGGRLEGSHALEWIQPTRRYLGDPVNRLLWTTGLSPVQQETLMSELRPVPTPWLWATPSVPG